MLSSSSRVCPVGMHWKNGSMNSLNSQSSYNPYRATIQKPTYTVAKTLPTGYRREHYLSAKESEIASYGYATNIPAEYRYNALDAASLVLSAETVLQDLGAKISNDPIIKADMHYVNILYKLSAPKADTYQMIPYEWTFDTKTRHSILNWVINDNNFQDTLGLLDQLRHYRSANQEAVVVINSDIDYLWSIY